MDYADIVATAGGALSDATTPVTLRLTEVVVDYPGAACVLLRCAPTASSPDVPGSVVVKRWNERGGHFRHEWAALAFLGVLPATRGLVPGLYGGDAAAELLVLEDLGEPGERLLGNILFGDSPQRAEAALLAFNATLGRLHAATIGQAETYRRIRLRHDARATSRHRVHRLIEELEALPGLIAANGGRVTPALEAELRAAIAAIRDPGPFLAFTHGDATPGNAFYTNDGVRLFDLETADFRHALVDGAFARLRYLQSVWARRIPVAIQRRGLRVYRRELIRGCPAAADDGVFSHALLACSAGWLAGLCGYLPSVADGDKKWGRSTFRQRIVAALDHFVLLAEDLEGFEALAASAADLACRLRGRWSVEESTMRLYPAFADSELPPGERGTT